MHIVWLKRDLRVNDHAPLSLAATRGPCLILYVYENELLDSEEFDPSHLVFINQCLKQLDERLRELGNHLTIRRGRLPQVFDDLQGQQRITHLWSHEETGNQLTYERDLRVKAWAASHGVAWTELPQTGVIRRLKSRDGWSRRWNQRMNQPLIAAPSKIQPVLSIEPGKILAAEALGLGESTKSEVQLGGELQATEVLESFLTVRGVNYRADMSTPVAGWEGCSRLSTYLAWGAISVKQVHQATEARRHEVRELKSAGEELDSRWSQSLSSFAGRLRWHCHFMQKLEDEPRLEFENMNRAYDGLRENEFDQSKFEAWCRGETGYPMVDACMRCLHATGWINFRMRAMLVSFASYHLWLHWRPTSIFLAKHFLDFEPGIHFSQFQMQAGVTGINTTRIYSPIKQVKDQDPTGIFIRRWVPELEGVPDEYLPEPHTMPLMMQTMAGCVIGQHYPAPIVEHKSAYKSARNRIHAMRKQEASRSEAKRVYAKHGSRRRPNPARQSRKKTKQVDATDQS